MWLHALWVHALMSLRQRGALMGNILPSLNTLINTLRYAYYIGLQANPASLFAAEAAKCVGVWHVILSLHS
jgi:hypothetical protein